ncbi:TPA: restriction endonuclease subunit S [Streptococcus suis]
MKDSGIEWIGEVPEDWGIGKLKYYFDVQLGKMLQPSATSGNDIEIDYLRAINVQWDNISVENLSKMWCNPSEVGKYEIKNGDLLICEGGEVGRCGIVEHLSDKAIIQNAVHRIRPTEKANVRFLSYYIQHTTKSKWFDILCNKATIAHLTSEKLLNTIVVLPSISEQRQIADFLDKKVAQLDKVKSLLEEQIKTLEDYRQSLIYETVTKGLDKTVPLKDSDVDWIGHIPEGWGIGRLKDFVKFQRGFGFPIELQGKDNGEIPFYKVSDLRGNLDEICVSKNYVDIQTTKQNAWVIVPAGAIIAPVIGAALLNNNRKISTTPFISDNNTLAIIPNNKNKYFYYLLKVIDMNWFNNSSTIPAVNISKLANQVIPTPKEEEQRQIADFLEVQTIKTDKLIEIKQKQIDNINQQRQTLIYDVVTGKRRV